MSERGLSVSFAPDDGAPTPRSERFAEQSSSYSMPLRTNPTIFTTFCNSALPLRSEEDPYRLPWPDSFTLQRRRVERQEEHQRLVIRPATALRSSWDTTPLLPTFRTQPSDWKVNVLVSPKSSFDIGRMTFPPPIVSKCKNRCPVELVPTSSIRCRGFLRND
jgi:hypothetical protein